MLAKAYGAAGETELARQEMRQYLAAAPCAGKVSLEGWMETLRH